MKNLRIMMVVFIATGLFAGNALSATLEEALIKCKNQSDSLQRLVCFDKVASRIADFSKNEHLVKQSSQAEPAPTSTVAEQTLTTKTTSNQIVSKAVPVQDSSNMDATSFGLKAPVNEPEELHTRIVGVFKGWKKGAILNMENGQRWKVISQDKGYTNKTNPKVVISKGVFGSYNIKAEGLNAVVKVRRID